MTFGRDAIQPVTVTYSLGKLPNLPEFHFYNCKVGKESPPYEVIIRFKHILSVTKMILKRELTPKSSYANLITVRCLNV